MRIIAFCYDFPHYKSCQGLMHLKANGFTDVICIAAPRKQLNIRPSLTRVTPIIEPLHPKDVARALGYEYIHHSHDDASVLDFIQRESVGVILGARVLRPHVVEYISIINMHPGLLPHNRGLDNLKWAILHGIPQGVTSHIIDSSVDRGYLIDKKFIDIYPDDTFLDVFLRLQNTELHLMIDALNRIRSGEVFDEKIAKGNYFKTVPDFLDCRLVQEFEIYKQNYRLICEKYLRWTKHESLDYSLNLEPGSINQENVRA